MVGTHELAKLLLDTPDGDIKCSIDLIFDKCDRRRNMENAKQEIIEHIKDRQVKFVKIVFGTRYSGSPQNKIEGDLNSVLPQLNFNYDSGYGGQELFGYIWYEDGTWSERGEYDGSEWWEHKTVPTMGCDIAT